MANVKATRIELPDVPEFESASGGVDLSEFDGQKAKIAKYEVIDGKSGFDEAGKPLPSGQTKAVKLLKVYTEPVTELTNKTTGEVIPVCATEIFSMKEQDGVWGISTNDKAKVQKFLKKLKVAKLRDIIGASVVIKPRETDKGGVFLGFYTA